MPPGVLLLYVANAHSNDGWLFVMIHKFVVNGEYILLDVNSGAVHVLDKVAYAVMDVFV